MSTKLSGKKKAEKRFQDRLKRHEAVMKSLSADKRGGYKKPGSQNFRKTGKR